jgi:hypothetical protein
MHRGDRVCAHIPTTVAIVTIVHAARALVTIAVDRARRLHVNLDSPVTLSAGRSGKGCDPMVPGSFLALLRSLEIAANPITVETTGTPGQAAGTIRAVGRDHVFIERESGH